MARIKPGTMPVSLPGVAQAITAVGPRRWQPSQIAMMREAERLREKRERGEPLDPREIQAWVNLAQTIMGDKTLIGGLVNLGSRKHREGKLEEARKATEARVLKEQQDLENQKVAEGMTARGEWPYAVPGLQQQYKEEVPGPVQDRYTRIAALGEAAGRQLLPEAQQGLVESAQREGELLARAGYPVPAAPVPAEQPVPAPAPAQPLRQPDALEEFYARERELQRVNEEETTRILREERVTVSDLFSLAAAARTPEAIRKVIRMVPVAVENDPAMAPKSIVELLFGSADKAPDVSKQLVDTWVSSMRTRRGLSAEERYKRAMSGRRAGAGGTKIEDDVIFRREDRPTKRRTDVAKLELTEAQADATRALAAKRRAEAARLVAKNERAKKWKSAFARRPATKGIPDDKRDLLALYATWADTRDKATITEGPWAAKDGKAMGAASASALADRLLLANVDAKSADFKALERSINHVRTKVFRPPTPKTPTPERRAAEVQRAYKNLDAKKKQLADAKKDLAAVKAKKTTYDTEELAGRAAQVKQFETHITSLEEDVKKLQQAYDALAK